MNRRTRDDVALGVLVGLVVLCAVVALVSAAMTIQIGLGGPGSTASRREPRLNLDKHGMPN